MRRSIIGVVVTLAFVALAIAVAAQSPEPWLGTWKANIANSSFSPGPAPQSQVTTWESLGGGQFKSTNVTVDVKGQSTRNETITRFDGADAPMKGPAVPTTRAYKRLDSRSFEYVQKVNGKSPRPAGWSWQLTARRGHSRRRAPTLKGEPSRTLCSGRSSKYV
jgi:hypothetical protein